MAFFGNAGGLVSPAGADGTALPVGSAAPGCRCGAEKAAADAGSADGGSAASGAADAGASGAGSPAMCDVAVGAAKSERSALPGAAAAQPPPPPPLRRRRSRRRDLETEQLLRARRFRLKRETNQGALATVVHFKTCFCLLEELFEKLEVKLDLGNACRVPLEAATPPRFDICGEYGGRFAGGGVAGAGGGFAGSFGGYAAEGGYAAIAPPCGVGEYSHEMLPPGLAREVPGAVPTAGMLPVFSFLDVACAPGGFSQFLLDGAGGRGVCRGGYGITLPVESGGFPVRLVPRRNYKLIYYDLLSHPRDPCRPRIPENSVEIALADAQHLPGREFAESALEAPAAAGVGAPAVGGDGALLAAGTGFAGVGGTPYYGGNAAAFSAPSGSSVFKNSHHGRLALLISQFRFALDTLKAGGYFIFRSAATELFPENSYRLLLLCLDIFDSVRPFKSEDVHYANHSFYVVCAGFRRHQYEAAGLSSKLRADFEALYNAVAQLPPQPLPQPLPRPLPPHTGAASPPIPHLFSPQPQPQPPPPQSPPPPPVTLPAASSAAPAASLSFNFSCGHAPASGGPPPPLNCVGGEGGAHGRLLGNVLQHQQERRSPAAPPQCIGLGPECSSRGPPPLPNAMDRRRNHPPPPPPPQSPPQAPPPGGPERRPEAASGAQKTAAAVAAVSSPSSPAAASGACGAAHLLPRVAAASSATRLGHRTSCERAELLAAPQAPVAPASPASAASSASSASFRGAGDRRRRLRGGGSHRAAAPGPRPPPRPKPLVTRKASFPTLGEGSAASSRSLAATGPAAAPLKLVMQSFSPQAKTGGVSWRTYLFPDVVSPRSEVANSAERGPEGGVVQPPLAAEAAPAMSAAPATDPVAPAPAPSAAAAPAGPVADSALALSGPPATAASPCLETVIGSALERSPPTSASKPPQSQSESAAPAAARPTPVASGDGSGGVGMRRLPPSALTSPRSLVPRQPPSPRVCGAALPQPPVTTPRAAVTIARPTEAPRPPHSAQGAGATSAAQPAPEAADIPGPGAQVASAFNALSPRIPAVGAALGADIPGAASRASPGASLAGAPLPGAPLPGGPLSPAPEAFFQRPAAARLFPEDEDEEGSVGGRAPRGAGAPGAGADGGDDPELSATSRDGSGERRGRRRYRPHKLVIQTRSQAEPAVLADLYGETLSRENSSAAGWKYRVLAEMLEYIWRLVAIGESSACLVWMQRYNGSKAAAGGGGGRTGHAVGRTGRAFGNGINHVAGGGSSVGVGGAGSPTVAIGKPHLAAALSASSLVSPPADVGGNQYWGARKAVFPAAGKEAKNVVADRAPGRTEWPCSPPLPQRRVFLDHGHAASGSNYCSTSPAGPGPPHVRPQALDPPMQPKLGRLSAAAAAAAPCNSSCCKATPRGAVAPAGLHFTAAAAAAVAAAPRQHQSVFMVPLPPPGGGRPPAVTSGVPYYYCCGVGAAGGRTDGSSNAAAVGGPALGASAAVAGNFSFDAHTHPPALGPHIPPLFAAAPAVGVVPAPELLLRGGSDPTADRAPRPPLAAAGPLAAFHT